MLLWMIRRRTAIALIIVSVGGNLIFGACGGSSKTESKDAGGEGDVFTAQDVGGMDVASGDASPVPALAPCTPDNGACTFSGGCCSGQCSAGVCALASPCRSAGIACSLNSDCCSVSCVGGQCISGTGQSFCHQSGDACTADVECCGGLCAMSAGGTGICGTVSVSGSGGGTLAGESCGDVYMNSLIREKGNQSTDLPVCGGSCASRTCLPWGPTGAFICQPPSGCHPTGELCQTDADCCGSATLPDGDQAGTICSKAAGAAFGICDQGHKCSPAGSICRLQDMSCNATDVCCSGNVQQYNTCQLDILGVPRCTISQNIDCTNPQSYAGKACASSADCCKLPCAPNPDGTSAFICESDCVAEGGLCTTSADCCASLLCDVAPGSTRGTCEKG
jgi:hypothetical protein